MREVRVGFLEGTLELSPECPGTSDEQEGWRRLLNRTGKTF